MTALEIIVLAGAALGALVYILRLAWKAVRGIQRGMAVLDAMHRLVAHELKPNGGGSLHDKVTRIDNTLTTHLTDAASDHERLVAVEQHLGLHD